MGFNISRRFKNVSYLEPGAVDDAEPFRATIRTNLTAAEIEEQQRLSEEARERLKDLLATMDDVEERREARKKALDETNQQIKVFYAPFVTGWNLEYVTDDGRIERLAPPSEAGAEAFDVVPSSVLSLLFEDIRSSAMERLDPKSSSVSKSTDATRVVRN